MPAKDPKKMAFGLIVVLGLSALLWNTLPEFRFRRHLEKNWNVNENEAASGLENGRRHRLGLILAIDGLPQLTSRASSGWKPPGNDHEVWMFHISRLDALSRICTFSISARVSLSAGLVFSSCSLRIESDCWSIESASLNAPFSIKSFPNSSIVWAVSMCWWPRTRNRRSSTLR